MNNQIILSKSKLITGLRCPRKLYLDCHQRGLGQFKSLAERKLFDIGIIIGQLARILFPQGTYINCKFWDREAILSLTKKYINEGIQLLFEPGFLYNNTFVRADVLIKLRGKDQWEIIEVKASSSVSSYSIIDLAIQVYVIRCSGLDIRKCYIMHLSGKTDINSVSDVFQKIDVTSNIEDIINTIPLMIYKMNEIIKSNNEPMESIGKKCFIPFLCSYYGYCKSTIYK